MQPLYECTLTKHDQIKTTLVSHSFGLTLKEWKSTRNYISNLANVFKLSEFHINKKAKPKPP